MGLEPSPSAAAPSWDKRRLRRIPCSRGAGRRLPLIPVGTDPHLPVTVAGHLLPRLLLHCALSSCRLGGQHGRYMRPEGGGLPARPTHTSARNHLAGLLPSIHAFFFWIRVTYLCLVCTRHSLPGGPRRRGSHGALGSCQSGGQHCCYMQPDRIGIHFRPTHTSNYYRHLLGLPAITDA